jgi:hypothetical protein
VRLSGAEEFSDANKTRIGASHRHSAYKPNPLKAAYDFGGPPKTWRAEAIRRFPPSLFSIKRFGI